MSHSSLVDVERVALTLGELLDGFVFVGGCAAVLLAPASIHPTLRPTEDVDCVVATTTYGAFRELEQELEKKGCQRCTDEGVICRWWINGVRVDLMPADESVLGLRSPWYADVLRAPVSVTLASGVSIQVVNLPVFLAMKFDAFSDRGQQDYLGNSDFEDIVTTLAYRTDCVHQIAQASAEVRAYLGGQAHAFLQRADAATIVSGCLPGDRTSQSAVSGVLERLGNIAGAWKPPGRP